MSKTIDTEKLREEFDDILIDYGGRDEAGTYTSGQYDLLLDRLAHMITAALEAQDKESRADENYACQQIVRSKWGTNDQLWDMQAHLSTPEKEQKI